MLSSAARHRDGDRAAVVCHRDHVGVPVVCIGGRLDYVVPGGVLGGTGRGSDHAARGAPEPECGAAVTAEPEPMMTIGEVASFWRVSPSTVRRWSEQGLLHPIRTPGGQRRFRASEVEACWRRVTRDR